MLLISVFQILNEATTFLNSINSKTDDGSSQNTNVHNNLWISRKVSSIPYKKADESKYLAYITVFYLNAVIYLYPYKQICTFIVCVV